MPDGGTLTIAAENASLDEGHVRPHPEAAPGPHVLITVADTGAGIPPDLIDKVFDPFFTTKEHGKGTGLGLSTALGIVKAHGGLINVSSEVGKGTRFAIHLPASLAAEATPARQERRELPAGCGELILVVDDEPLIRETARTALEGHGYRVLTAIDGGEGLAAYRQHREEIRAVLLDLMMPGPDGAAIMEALHQLNSQVRILAMSGLRATERVAEVLAAGRHGFLQKPFTDEDMLAALAEALRPEIALPGTSANAQEVSWETTPDPFVVPADQPGPRNAGRRKVQTITAAPIKITPTTTAQVRCLELRYFPGVGGVCSAFSCSRSCRWDRSCSWLMSSPYSWCPSVAPVSGMATAGHAGPPKLLSFSYFARSLVPVTSAAAGATP
jgi:CheY-like chemotaxis protein